MVGKILGKFIIFAAFAVGSASAMAATQFTVSGTIDSAGGTLAGDSFTVVITYDSSVAGQTSGGAGTTIVSQWNNSVTSVSYEIRDPNNNNSVVVSANMTMGDSTEPTLSDYTKITDDGTTQSLEWYMFNFNGTDTGDIANAMFDGLPANTLSSSTTFPDPTELEGIQGPKVRFMFANLRVDAQGNTVQLSGSGPISSVTVGPVDSDGDGIADSLDSCPHSNISEDVMVNGIDTGVLNSLQPNGCTIMDAIAGATSPKAMARALDQLEDNGVITHRQMGKIERAAAKHHGHHRVRKHHSWDHHSADRDHDHHSGDRDHDHHSWDHDRG